MSMRINQSQLVLGFKKHWAAAQGYTIAHRLPGGLNSLRRCPPYPRNPEVYAIAGACLGAVIFLVRPDWVAPCGHWLAQQAGSLFLWAVRLFS